MKKKLISNLLLTQNKLLPFFHQKNMSSTISSLRTQLTHTESFISKTANKKRGFNSPFQYPITTHTSLAVSPIATNRNARTIERPIKTKRFINPKKKQSELLTFNKKLKIFFNIDKNDKTKKELIKVTQQNIEEIYFDYDKNNHKKKMDTFSGNNAKVLRNKILFVKGVMDYMFPKMMIKKMNFLTKVKRKEFENEMQQQMKDHQQNHNIYHQRIKSATDGVLMSKYSQGAPSWNGNHLKLNKDKKVMINNRIVYRQSHLSDYIS